MKQPVNLVPITVANVGLTRDIDTQNITSVWVGNLMTNGGPRAATGRSAILTLSHSQAECLLLDLAAALGATVS
jgi:hypothetical protein